MKKRVERAARVSAGFAIAVFLTLLMMAGLTVAVWRTDMSDSMLTLLNQLMKITCIAFGTFVVVRRAGEAGFLTGALIGIMYMAAGYGIYAALGGAGAPEGIAGEMLIGAAAGALTGALAVNLPKSKRSERART